MDTSGDERAASVQANVERWASELAAPQHDLVVRRVSGQWDEQSFYSSERELAFEVWLIVSGKCRVANKQHSYNHMFGNSVLLKRGACGVQQPMSRAQFKNWKVPVGFEGAGGSNNSMYVEQLQWFSGQELLSSLVKGLVKGSVLKKSKRVQIVDFCMLDDEPGQSCINMNTSESLNDPRVGYCGVSWAPEKQLVRDVIQENVATSLGQAVKAKLRGKQYQVATGVTIPDVVASAQAQAGEAPKCNLKDYELTVPRVNLELPLKLSTVTQGKALGGATVDDPLKPGTAITWEMIQKAHDDEFNPSGVPCDPDSRKRSAEESVSDLHLEQCPAVSPTPASPPPDTAQLCKTDVATSEFEVWLQPDGLLYLKALADTVLLPDIPLFSCKGNFKVGAAAKEAKSKSGQQIIKGEMTSETVVLLTQDTTKSQLELPKSPIPLKTALAALANLRQVLGDVFKHKVSQGPTGERQVTATDDIAFVLEVSKPSSKPLGNNKQIKKDIISSYVDYGKLCLIEAVHHVKYDSDSKSLRQGIPCMHFKSATR
ncbi:unnamed protein product, partial [Effrenium voratum]